MLTIHQPSSDICERFDDLILLSCGRMLYCGPWGDADSYFASAGFECAHNLIAASSFTRLMPVQSCMLDTLMAPEEAARMPGTASNASMHWVLHMRATDCTWGTQEHSCTSAHQRYSSMSVMYYICTLLVSEIRVCCRRPGYRSTAEHILTLCKDKEYAVPFLAGQYQKSLIDHALHRLDSQVSMVSALLGALLWRLPSSTVALSGHVDE